MNVVCLLVGMMIVVNVLTQTGVFEWLAISIAQKARGNGLLIFLGLINATAFASAFLDNVTTMVLIAPITILIAQILELQVVPFLVYGAIFSNLGGTATLIGDPPNVLIGSQAKLPFNQFIIHLTPIILICMAAVSVVLALALRKTLRVRPEARARMVLADASRAIVDPRGLRRSGVVFALILAGFFLGHPLGMEPGFVALAGAVVMVLVNNRSLHESFRHVEWETLAFLAGLFIMIGALEHQGLFEKASAAVFSVTKGHFFVAVMVIMWGCGIFSSIVDNIPVVLAMVPMIRAMIPEFAADAGWSASPEMVQAYIADPLWWSLALGACLGGNGTLFGAAANVVTSQLAKKNGYPISFMAFTRKGFPVMILTLTLCSVYVYLRYFMFAPHFGA
jgi:Na+/H+ antiporter NhaD/arsenite permease-like protein